MTSPELCDRVTGPYGPGSIRHVERLTDGRVSYVTVELDRGGTHSVPMRVFRREYAAEEPTVER